MIKKIKPNFISPILFVIIGIVIILTIITFFYFGAIVYLAFVLFTGIVLEIHLQMSSWTIEKGYLIQKSPFNNVTVPINQIESIVREIKFFRPTYKIKIKEKYIKKSLPNVSTFDNAEIMIAQTNQEETKKFIDFMMKNNKKIKSQEVLHSKEIINENEVRLKYTEENLKTKFVLSKKIRWILILLSIFVLVLFYFYPGKVTLLFIAIVIAIVSFLQLKRELKMWEFIKQNREQLDYNAGKFLSNTLRVRGKTMILFSNMDLLKQFSIVIFSFFLLLILVILLFV
jgi:hypothetical protein